MGQPQGGGPFNDGFFQQKGSQALVKALPQDLLNEPHHLGKPCRHNLVGKVRQWRGGFHDPLVDFGGNHPERGILFRLDGDVKLDGPHHAGGGEQAQVALEKPVQGYLPPLGGQHKGPELAALHQQKPGAVRIAAVHNLPLAYLSEEGAAAQGCLLLCRELTPHGEKG